MYGRGHPYITGAGGDVKWLSRHPVMNKQAPVSLLSNVRTINTDHKIDVFDDSEAFYLLLNMMDCLQQCPLLSGPIVHTRLKISSIYNVGQLLWSWQRLKTMAWRV